jgi:hypothetical protein
LAAICDYLPKYKSSFLNLKINNYEIIGNAHKSPSNINLDTRLKLLQQMISNLRDRSLVDEVYVSISSQASSPFNDRELNTSDEIMKKLEHVTRNTLGKNNKKYTNSKGYHYIFCLTYNRHA